MAVAFKPAALWVWLALSLAAGLAVAFAGCTFEIQPVAGETANGPPQGTPDLAQPVAPPPQQMPPAPAPDLATPAPVAPSDCRSDGCPDGEVCVPDKHGVYDCESSDNGTGRTGT
jgi:hypothetical protein